MKKKISSVTYKHGDIVSEKDLHGGCPKCNKYLRFEPGDGLDTKLSTSCCGILYVAYPKTWEVLIEEMI